MLSVALLQGLLYSEKPPFWKCRGQGVMLECHDESERYSSEVARNMSHIFLAKASHMTKPDLTLGREISNSHREMEQIIRNKEITTITLYLKCYHVSLLVPILQNLQSSVILSFVKCFCCHQAELIHFSSSSKSSKAGWRLSDQWESQRGFSFTPTKYDIHFLILLSVRCYVPRINAMREKILIMHIALSIYRHVILK